MSQAQPTPRFERVCRSAMGARRSIGGRCGVGWERQYSITLRKWERFAYFWVSMIEGMY